jgi:hypothetical protein
MYPSHRRPAESAAVERLGEILGSSDTRLLCTHANTFWITTVRGIITSYGAAFARITLKSLEPCRVPCR